ncbi:hypothetical protein [Fulvivirga sediminis]|uniref:Uncharacterized protein n=1 Tax=Fulvivirga sediminis TaxID=2803949 RepID=A0A937FBG3_9BACT|nr:hypothetical protein [Fulvivirga sediminis]MBL3658567.1 hypothetical protein [Fulvivirga sediminis]
MRKVVYENQIVFEVDSEDDIARIDLKSVDRPYSVRIIRNNKELIHRTILSFSKEGLIQKKVFYIEDVEGNELECIEYDKNEKIIRRMEYENYPDGETKWMYVYDSDGNLINKEFFEED